MSQYDTTNEERYDENYYDENSPSEDDCGNPELVFALPDYETISLASALLISAASANKTGRVQALLELGADINAQPSDGQTALMAAALGGHECTVRFLMDHGADPGATDSNGLTAADMAARESQVDDAEVAKTYADIAAVVRGQKGGGHHDA